MAAAPDNTAPSGIPLDRSGGKLSTLYLKPRLEVSTRYDDNIFLTETGTKSDRIDTASPSLALVSDWERHRVYASAKLEAVRYADASSENHDDWNAGIGGNIAIRDDMSLTLHAGTRQEREARTAPESGGAGVPMARIDRADTDVEFIHTSGIMEWRAALESRHWRFDRNAVQDNTERNRSEIRATARATMGLGEEWGVYIAPAYEIQDYAHATDAGGVNRDADIAEILAGIAYRVTDLTRLEAGVGIAAIDPADPALKSGHTTAADMQLHWTPLDILEVDTTLHRRIDTTTLAGVSDIVVTEGRAEARYAYTEYLSLHAGFGLRHRDFAGSTRKDDDTVLDAGMEYALTDAVALTAGGKHTRRDSNAALRSFDNTLFMAGVSIGV
ncbi:MAG: outer membrane beta-barrel protein [Alphaproteobacteria bacterium]|nr:outer membrane beta-barrel protein [Alphaproteobacteria bacterium]